MLYSVKGENALKVRATVSRIEAPYLIAATESTVDFDNEIAVIQNFARLFVELLVDREYWGMTSWLSRKGPTAS